MRYWWAIPFVLLPIQPAWFAAAMALTGVAALAFRKERIGFVMPFVLFALLGAGSQLLGPGGVEPEIASLLPEVSSKRQTTNLIPPNGLRDLYGWNPEDGPGPVASRQPDGLRRITRKHPVTNRPFTDILSSRSYPLREGEWYTQSFYFRHDGDEISFDFVFNTQAGFFVVPVTIEAYPNGLKRAYASYKTRVGDRSMRAIYINNFRGDWTYIDIGYAQLEVGSVPSPYAVSGAEEGRKQRAGWWVGTAVLGALTLAGSCFVLKRSGEALPSLGTSVGLLTGLIVGLSQPMMGQRILGFTDNPNLYGAGAVMSAALTGIWGSKWLGFFSLGLALVMVVLSGSRAALLALLGAVPIWFSRLGSRWSYIPLMLSGVLVVLALYSGLSSHLERLSTVTDLSYTNNQSRLEIWAVAWRAFLEHPLTGIGIGEFQFYYRDHVPPNAIERDATHAHNLFLNVLAEAGLLGLLGFLILWGGVVVRVWQLRQWGVLIIIAVAVVMNLFDYTWFYAGVHYPLWVAVAWALSRPYKPGLLPPDRMRG